MTTTKWTTNTGTTKLQSFSYFQFVFNQQPLQQQTSTVQN